MSSRLVSHASAMAALVLPALLLQSSLLAAADVDGRFAVKSVGGTKCSMFVETMKAKNQSQIALYVGWVAGYLSAANQMESATFDLAPWQDMRTLTALLTQHCDRNADLRFGAATAQMVHALKPDRLSSRSEIVSVEHEGKSIQLYQETLRRAQSALAELGMFSGDIDGAYGDETRAALTRFQKESKLLPTSGLPDQQTLFALFRAAQRQSQ